MKKALSVLAIAATVSSHSVSAQESLFIDPLDGFFDASTFLAENAYGFLPVPVIITDPAVDGGLGMMGLFS